MQQRISVIVTAHNEERFVGDALRSVRVAAIGLDPDLVEVVVADDRSVDRTVEQVERAAAELPFVVRIVEAAGEGASSARNAAVAASTGDVLAPLDHDDLYAPHALANHLAVLRRQGGGLTFGGAVNFRGAPPDPSREDLVVLRGAIPGAMAVQRGLLESVGGFVVGEPLAEWPRTFELLRLTGGPMGSTPEVVMLRRVHDRNVSRGLDGDRSGYARALKQILDARRVAARSGPDRGSAGTEGFAEERGQRGDVGGPIR